MSSNLARLLGLHSPRCSALEEVHNLLGMTDANDLFSYVSVFEGEYKEKRNDFIFFWELSRPRKQIVNLCLTQFHCAPESGNRMQRGDFFLLRVFRNLEG